MAEALGSNMQCRGDIPVPDTVAGERGMVAVPLARRSVWRGVGLSEGVVRKLLNPNHRSHISQIESALEKVGRRLVAGDATV